MRTIKAISEFLTQYPNTEVSFHRYKTPGEYVLEVRRPNAGLKWTHCISEIEFEENGDLLIKELLTKAAKDLYNH